MNDFNTKELARQVGSDKFLRSLLTGIRKQSTSRARKEEGCKSSTEKDEDRQAESATQSGVSIDFLTLQN